MVSRYVRKQDMTTGEVAMDVAGAALPYGITKGLQAVKKSGGTTLVAKQAENLRKTLEARAFHTRRELLEEGLADARELSREH